MNSDRFSTTLRAADANNIVLLLDFNQILSSYEPFKADNIVEHTIALEDLHAKVGLFSLLEANSPDINALSSEAAQDAAWAKVLKEGQKIYLEIYTAKGNGPWRLEGEEVLQNRNSLEQPWSLMGLMGTNSTALLGESLKLGVKIASKAQGVGGLKGSDYIHICGTWRKNTKIESKKKDDGIEALNARMTSLEILLEGMLSNLPPNVILGRGQTAGAVSIIPASAFATPAQVSASINSLVGQSSQALDTLAELGAALGNDANFASNIVNQLASKAPLPIEGIFSPSIIGLTSAGEATYLIQKGTFTKLGRRVTFELFLEWNAHSGTGNARIINLPYASGNDASTSFSPVYLWHRNFTLAANYQIMAYVIEGQSSIRLTQVPIAGGPQIEVALDSTAGLMIGGSYLATS